MTEIRRLEQEDFKHLLLIEAESFNSGYSPYFIRMIPVLYSNTSFVAVKGRSSLGYIAAAIEQGNPRRAWILTLAVRPKYRGMGIGQELMTKGLEALAKAGAEETLLTVAPDNSKAISLYERFGFVTAKTLEDFFGPGEHRQLMKKTMAN